MGFYVYILKCSDGSYYTGDTDNLEGRLAAHQQGEIPGYAQERRPVELVFSEELPSREDALARERQIKGWSRAKKEALINHDWDRLAQLAKARGSAASRPLRGERLPSVRGELVEP
jgi:predicted GIY-YIG superfamily endonuclease